MRSAYLLISHGSRDPRSRMALEYLANSIRQQLEKKHCLTSPSLNLASAYYPDRGETSVRAAALLSKPQSLLVGTAYLELAPLPLHQKIQQLARQAEVAGVTHIKLLPLFLLPGVHVQEDIPSEVALAQERLGKEVELELCPYLGSYPILRELLAAQFVQLSAEARILLSHGSRRLGANQACEVIATFLEAVTAYWSVSPSLAQQVQNLVEMGTQSIAILPYFLFPGGITDAIAHQVCQLQQQFPQVKLLLGEPLGTSAELAHFIVEEIQN